MEGMTNDGKPVYGLWWGGASYSVGYVPDIGEESSSVEKFPDLATAKAEFLTRYASGRRNTWYYVSNPEDDRGSDTPAVGEDCEMQLWHSDPRGSDDPYPDAVMRLGLDREHALVEHC